MRRRKIAGSPATGPSAGAEAYRWPRSGWQSRVRRRRALCATGKGAAIEQGAALRKEENSQQNPKKIDTYHPQELQFSKGGKLQIPSVFMTQIDFSARHEWKKFGKSFLEYRVFIEEYDDFQNSFSIHFF